MLKGLFRNPLEVKKKVVKKWAFSNVASLIKYHLDSYIKLFEFLKNLQASLKSHQKSYIYFRDGRVGFEIQHCYNLFSRHGKDLLKPVGCKYM